MITWSINQLERYTSDGGVITAHWGCVAADQGVGINNYGSCGFAPDPSAPDFVPFEQLTQDDVLAWVYTQIDKDAVEADVQARLDAKLNPTVVAGVPW